MAPQSGGAAKRTRQAAADAGRPGVAKGSSSSGDDGSSSGGGGSGGGGSGGGGSDGSGWVGKTLLGCAKAAGGRPRIRRLAPASTGNPSKAQKAALADVRAEFLAGLSAKERKQWTSVGGAGVERGVRAWVGERPQAAILAMQLLQQLSCKALWLASASA